MSELSPSDFAAFFEAVHGHRPFPWQCMLLEQVIQNGWPDGIDLPTASGKTACIDIAVFALALGQEVACQARRRIFFVVDRRIVVDEAHERAARVAGKLQRAEEGLLRIVADRLRQLAAGETPLVVSRLRGGTLRDDDWMTNAAQPAVITSTVDQVGSRLLFRSYGASHLSSPVEAGLACCDSLLLLDEAHCAVPFSQTLRAVGRYAGPDWSTADPPVLFAPLQFSLLSATLPAETTCIFPAPEKRDQALNSDILQQRIQARKPAKLVEAKKPKKKEWTLGEFLSDDHLVLTAAQQAADWTSLEDHPRVVIMVNRVATAGRIRDQLAQAVHEGILNADVVLMTGRMRPIDRDRLVQRWSSLLKAGSDCEPDRPVIVVTTQCLEVGADFSFDALITECASLDALRQRFGRLDRLGTHGSPLACVIVRKGDVKPDEKLKDDAPLDPIYGNALSRTWSWLCSNADSNDEFDFGIQAIDAKLPPRGQLAGLLAPSPDAPILLPAHLDLLCQTQPRPTPDPDVALYLHGRQTGPPEAQVVFRSDLADLSGDRKWIEAVALLPPVSAEALTVPLPVLRACLASEGPAEPLSNIADVEGAQARETDEPAGRGAPFIRWRGSRDAIVSRDPRDIQPNDTIVVSAKEELSDSLGYAFNRHPGSSLDIAEDAYLSTRRRPLLRLLPSILRPWRHVPAVDELLSWSASEDRDEHELPSMLQSLAACGKGDGTQDVPEWIAKAAEEFVAASPRIELHPSGNIVLIGSTMQTGSRSSSGPGEDADDSLSAADGDVKLGAHVSGLAEVVHRWSERCLPESLRRPVTEAARLHDLGKADPRFQIMLHGSETDAAVALAGGTILAKSRGPQRPWPAQQQLRRAAGLPDGFRHEMLSMQLVEAAAVFSEEPDARNLLLHLIASHHGHARPFAPVVIDIEMPDVGVRLGEDSFALRHEQRQALPPAHRLDSGVPERFWRLTRRFGWWGLAYIEAVLRSADRYVSARQAQLSQEVQA